MAYLKVSFCNPPENSIITPRVIDLEMSGKIGVDYSKSRITLKSANNQVAIIQADALFKLANKIRGCEFNEIKSIMEDAQVESNFTYSIIEQEVIKAFFNSFLWLEFCLIESEDVDITLQMYDEFIIDLNGRPERQRDIYFPPFDYFQAHSSQLESLYLSAKIGKIEVRTSSLHINYFIPFNKEFFRPNFNDPTLRELAQYRQVRINDFMKYRQ
jgi:hypothetical protein